LGVRCWNLGFRELKKIYEALDLPRQRFEDGEDFAKEAVPGEARS
jgi:hypothetical protein